MRHNDRRSGSCYRNADTMSGAACRVLTFTPLLSCPTMLIPWGCRMVCFHNPPWAMANKHHPPIEQNIGRGCMDFHTVSPDVI